MARIGILGGSFNPPHKAHKAMARAAREQYHLDTVFWMPTARPPHKSDKSFVSDDHRSRMVKLVIESMEDGAYRFSDYELKKGGVNYTCETLEAWKQNHPEDELYFILGGDSLKSFDRWRKPKKISRLATILAAPRSGMPENKLEKLCKKRTKEYPGLFLPIHMKEKLAKISSTELRKDIAVHDCSDQPEGLSGRVWQYICLHGLYGREPLQYQSVPSEKVLLKCLRSTLRPKRFRHTIGVANTAEELGKLYSEGDETMADRARLAGLLHDCGKYYTDREQIELCDRFGIALTETERANPSLIHGKLGAYLALNRYGVKDEEILSAIRVHTVGKPDMSVLEKILYIADYIEPGRVIPGALHPLEEIRKLVMHDLDGALIDTIENTIAYLKESGRVIDEASLATLSYYEGKADKI
ncbi:MAG: nicotinate (nicotinamide) nucleotide adenylyltransferase [Eubacterium sp.]|nr:nicotinate (nicotinamide) nucleotide adenylyltransferase [Eubacterium sp.]